MSPKSQERQSSQRSSEHDIRNLWTTATLSQTQLHLPLSYFCEKFDEDGGTVRTSAPGWLSPEELWREEEVSSPKGDRTRLESEPRDQHTLLDQQLHRGSSEEGHVEEDDEESNLSSGQWGLARRRGEGGGDGITGLADLRFCRSNNIGARGRAGTLALRGFGGPAPSLPRFQQPAVLGAPSAGNFTLAPAAG